MRSGSRCRTSDALYHLDSTPRIASVLGSRRHAAAPHTGTTSHHCLPAAPWMKRSLMQYTGTRMPWQLVDNLCATISNAQRMRMQLHTQENSSLPRIHSRYLLSIDPYRCYRGEDAHPPSINDEIAPELQISFLPGRDKRPESSRTDCNPVRSSHAKFTYRTCKGKDTPHAYESDPGMQPLSRQSREGEDDRSSLSGIRSHLTLLMSHRGTRRGSGLSYQGFGTGPWLYPARPRETLFDHSDTGS